MKKGFYQIQSKSFADYGVSCTKDLWSKLKDEGYKGLSATVETKYKKSELADALYHAVFSTQSVDRHGDIVVQNFVLDSYAKNPVYLDSHNYDSIEHIIGKVHNIATLQGTLSGDIEFAVMNPKGLLAQQLVDKGFANASSIGFMPLEFDDTGRITKSELLEISMVSVPANPEALIEKKIEVKSITPTETKIEIKKDNPKKSVAKIVAQIAAQKEKNFNLIVKLAKEMVIDDKKEKARKLHQVIRELSK